MNRGHEVLSRLERVNVPKDRARAKTTTEAVVQAAGVASRIVATVAEEDCGHPAESISGVRAEVERPCRCPLGKTCRRPSARPCCGRHVELIMSQLSLKASAPSCPNCAAIVAIEDDFCALQGAAAGGDVTRRLARQGPPVDTDEPESHPTHLPPRDPIFLDQVHQHLPRGGPASR